MSEDEERQKEERRREAIKLQFEYLKHLTILAGTTAAVEITVDQLAELRLDLLGFTLVPLGLCIFGALVLMGRASTLISEGGTTYNRVGLLFNLYLIGLMLFALEALHVHSMWIALIIFSAVILFLLYLERQT